MKKLFFALMVGMFLISFASADLFSGVVDYYQFDTTTGFNDTLGATNFTTYAGSPVIFADGLINQAYNSTPGQITANKALWDFPVNTTLNFWFKEEGTAATNQVLLSKVDASSLVGWYMRHPGSGTASKIFLFNTFNSGDFMIASANTTYQMISMVMNDTAITVYVNGQLNKSDAPNANIAGGSSGLIFGKSLAGFADGKFQYDEMGWWNRSLNSSEITSLYNSGAGTPYTSSIVPLAVSTTLNSPANKSTFTSTITFNASVTPTNGNITNATLWVWNSSGSIINQTTNTLLGNALNSTIWNVDIPSIGNYKWNAYGCAANSTGSLCAFNNENRTFVYGFANNVTAQPTTVYQTQTGIPVNITFDVPSGSNATGYYWWNNTAYSATAVNINATRYMLNYSLGIPITVSGSVNTFWQVSVDGTNIFNSSVATQTVTPLLFYLCNTTNNVPYVNFTFQDVATLTNLNGSFSPLVLNYYLGDGSITNSYTFTNTSANPSYAFCFAPNQSTMYNNGIRIAYSATNYPQRNYFLSKNLTATVTDVVLYLLGISSGQTVSFQVITSSGSPLQNAMVTVNESVGGSSTNTMTGFTDSSGLTSFFMNPNTQYNVVATYTGLPTTSVTLSPSNTQYTITMGNSAATNTTATQTATGVGILISPIGSQLVNNTLYNINMTTNSSYSPMSLWGYYLYDQSGNLIDSQTSTTATGGFLSSNVNTYLNGSLRINYFYVINGYTQNGTKVWFVMNTGNTQWSISNFVSDLLTYLNVSNGEQSSPGLFGLTLWGLNLIIFVIIFTTVGILSWKFGLTSPTAVMVVLFGLVAFFDVGIGLIVNPLPGAVPHIVTILVGLITLTVVVRENMY